MVFQEPQHSIFIFLYKKSEKVILKQMQIERKLNTFYYEMNKLKDSSVMKKTAQQKKGVYLELKRKEEERIRKEKEDAEKNKN